MKSKFFNILIVCLIIGLSCSSCKESAEIEEKAFSSPLSPVSFELEMMSAPYDLADTQDGSIELDPLDYYFHPGQSVLLISQRGETFEPFSEANPTKTYKYTYYVNDEANWDRGYNFEPYGEDALDWDLIKNYQYNGNFAFGALYYPISNESTTSVKKDQSNFNDYLSSDILGTYHLTSELESRLRFRFFHLMACINVKLWVPDWSAEDNTGFFDDAVKKAEILDMITDFELKWGEKSTEEPPTASTENLPDPQKSDIRMYLFPTDSPREVITKDLSSFNQKLDNDNIREYNFRVLLPPQTLSSDNSLIRFTLTKNDKEKTYLFATRNITSGSLSVAAGSMSNIIIYLPRFENEAILIKAEIIDWINGNTEFTARPRNN